MRRLSLLCLLLVPLLAQHRCIDAQSRSAPGESAESYRLKVAVDEVSLTFHAADAHGLPVNDLKLDELILLDNGKPPRRIIGFHPLQDLSLRAGILIDTSESMQENVSVNRAISIQFAQRLLRQQTDQAFVMDFGYLSRITQPWTSEPAALVAGIQQVVQGRENPLGGTAMFDTLFRACFNVFGNVDRAASGNFILLFSDGEDNASHTSLEEVVDICQHANTAIYAFRAEPAPNLFSGGPKSLADLAQQTGGRVFPSDDSDAGIDTDLRIIEADLRNQYRLIYNPEKLTHDGAFHRIELKTPERVESVSIRSGYYDRPR
jgi:VWFA-related protein